MDIQWSLVLFTALTGMGGWLFYFICLNVFVRKTDKGAFAGTATALALTVVGGWARCSILLRASSPKPCWWVCWP